ncbi:unnamed protein product [Urochloa humidicola]
MTDRALAAGKTEARAVGCGFCEEQRREKTGSDGGLHVARRRSRAAWMADAKFYEKCSEEFPRQWKLDASLKKSAPTVL